MKIEYPPAPKTAWFCGCLWKLQHCHFWPDSCVHTIGSEQSRRGRDNEVGSPGKPGIEPTDRGGAVDRTPEFQAIWILTLRIFITD